jgi:hypothetical protein
MAFGQQSGPPASQREVRELLARLQAAGHEGFRDARGPMGFTQRQAGGRFTRDEAAAFIDALQEAADAGCDPGRPPVPARRAPAPRETAVEKALRRATPEQLAAELQRRGWAVIEP